MRPYIDFNIQKRTVPNNEANKNFLKLMNNSVYDKTLENLRKNKNKSCKKQSRLY